jgi:hypothetical protein
MSRHPCRLATAICVGINFSALPERPTRKLHNIQIATYNSADTTMEEDRAQSDLGLAADIAMAEDIVVPQVKPKKRFIGRRAAAERAQGRSEANGSIEETQVQGKTCFRAC